MKTKISNAAQKSANRYEAKQVKTASSIWNDVVGVLESKNSIFDVDNIN